MTAPVPSAVPAARGKRWPSSSSSGPSAPETGRAVSADLGEGEAQGRHEDSGTVTGPVDVEHGRIARARPVSHHLPPEPIGWMRCHVVGDDVDEQPHSVAVERCQEVRELLGRPELRVEPVRVGHVVAMPAVWDRSEDRRDIQRLDSELVQVRDLLASAGEADPRQLHPVGRSERFLCHSLGRSLWRKSSTECDVKLTTSFRTRRVHGPGWAVLRTSSQRPGSSIRGKVYERERQPAFSNKSNVSPEAERPLMSTSSAAWPNRSIPMLRRSVALQSSAVISVPSGLIQVTSFVCRPAGAWPVKSAPTQDRVALHHGDEIADEVVHVPTGLAYLPIEPAQLAVLAVCVVIAVLGSPDLVAAEEHGHALGEEQGREHVPFHAVPGTLDPHLVRGSLDAPVRAVVCVRAVVVLLGVGLIVPLLVADQVGEREAVVAGYEVDAGIGTPAAWRVDVARAGEP